MTSSSLMIQLANFVLSILEFMASPTGGRDIGRDILQKVGLRGGPGQKK